MEDYGRRDWELPCVCGHNKIEHRKGHESGRCICLKCYYRGLPQQYHTFKLDNLAYVEQVARAKGLV
jgi:hypothetical protein